MRTLQKRKRSNRNKFLQLIVQACGEAVCRNCRWLLPTLALALTTSTGMVRIASQIFNANACFDGLAAAVGPAKTKDPDHDHGDLLTGTASS